MLFRSRRYLSKKYDSIAVDPPVFVMAPLDRSSRVRVSLSSPRLFSSLSLSFALCVFPYTNSTLASPRPFPRHACISFSRISPDLLLRSDPLPFEQGHNIMSLPVTASAAREVDVVGVFRYRNAYPTAIQLVASGYTSCLFNLLPYDVHHYVLFCAFFCLCFCAVILQHYCSVFSINAILIFYLTHGSCSGIMLTQAC